MKKLFMIICLVLIAVPALAGDILIKFAWDRSPETVVTGYQLYRKSLIEAKYEAIGDLIPQVVEGEEPRGSDVIPDTPGITYWYVVTAKSNGLESGLSNEVTVTSLTIPVLRIEVTVGIDVH